MGSFGARIAAKRIACVTSSLELERKGLFRTRRTVVVPPHAGFHYPPEYRPIDAGAGRPVRVSAWPQTKV